jgi:ABC-2 type transport system ATP-binding protein
LEGRPTSIEVEAVSKRFGSVRALDSVSLDVRHGEIVALLGANGAGKSTLLKILGTTVLPDEGRAVVAGHNVVCNPRAVRRATGFLLADERSWYWRLSGRKNLEFFAALHGFRRRAARDVADRLLNEAGLEDAADRAFSGYSSGMKLRLSLARALLADPVVLLLDEPTRSLDPLASLEFRTLLEQIVATRGAGVLFATHDLHEAAAVASKVLVLVEGRAAATAPHTDAAALERLLIEAQS